MSARIPSSSSSRLMLTIGLCFLVALMEGLDLQAAGIAAGGIAQAFALDKNANGLDIQRRNTRFATRRAGWRNAGGPLWS